MISQRRNHLFSAAHNNSKTHQRDSARPERGLKQDKVDKLIVDYNSSIRRSIRY